MYEEEWDNVLIFDFKGQMLGERCCDDVCLKISPG